MYGPMIKGGWRAQMFRSFQSGAVADVSRSWEILITPVIPPNTTCGIHAQKAVIIPSNGRRIIIPAHS
jgi:hypothetical protein